jgi:hypothetical protein
VGLAVALVAGQASCETSDHVVFTSFQTLGCRLIVNTQVWLVLPRVRRRFMRRIMLCSPPFRQWLATGSQHSGAVVPAPGQAARQASDHLFTSFSDRGLTTWYQNSGVVLPAAGQAALHASDHVGFTSVSGVASPDARGLLVLRVQRPLRALKDSWIPSWFQPHDAGFGPGDQRRRVRINSARSPRVTHWALGSGRVLNRATRPKQSRIHCPPRAGP